MRRVRRATPPGVMVMVHGCFRLRFACFSGLVGGLALAPSVGVGGPRGTDFVHVCLYFACILLVFRGWWGPRPRPSVVVGPPGADFVHFRLYFAYILLVLGPSCG